MNVFNHTLIEIAMILVVLISLISAGCYHGDDDYDTTSHTRRLFGEIAPGQ